MAGIIGIGTSLLGAAGSAKSLLGGSGASKVKGPAGFDMPNMGGAANSAYGLANSINNNSQQAQNVGQSLYNNPYQQDVLQGARNASTMGMDAANSAYGAGNDMYNTGLGLLPYAQRALDQGFDPQNELYARTFQQNTDQQRAAQAARGIAMTPYGAGIESESINNFNIDWQNNLLQRQATAANTAQGLYNTSARNVIGGQGMMGEAPGAYLGAASYPYSTFGTLGNDQLAALMSSSAMPQQSFENFLSYIGQGTQAAGASNANFNSRLAQQGQGYNQDVAAGQGLGASLSGLANKSNWNWLGNLFGGNGGGAGAYNAGSPIY